MNPPYWHEKWQTNDIMFHKIGTHPLLIANSKYLLPGKVIVPLCGKSLDMMYLQQEGHDVVGFELSPIACEAFFSENNLRYEKITKGNIILYQSSRISIWCGDIFSLPDEAWKDFSGIYDRAAIVALPPDVRKKYSKLVIDQMKKNSSTFRSALTICVEYTDETIEGPPFSVNEKEIKKLYGKALKVKKISTTLDPHLSGRAPRFQKVHVHEKVYVLEL